MLAAVGVVTDICRAMSQPTLGAYMQKLMELLYTALRTPAVPHGVKPQLIAAFGDAALALGAGFVDVSFVNCSSDFIYIILVFESRTRNNHRSM